MRMYRCVAVLCLLGALCVSPLQAATPLQLAWLDAKGAHLSTLNGGKPSAPHPLPDTLTTPLGSLWKLLVYAYLVENQTPEHPYICRGQNREEEVYCCESGESITRDKALVRSCGLYFKPQRLGISPQAWQTFWQSYSAPLWLQQRDNLQPDTHVPVHELLGVLANLPARQTAQTLLLDVMTQTDDGALLGLFGSRLRVKTWSWHQPSSEKIGGFAGWLSEGTPIWAQASGTSKTVLKQHAEALRQWLPASPPSPQKACVQVKLFSRYPIQTVWSVHTQQPATAGPLKGRYTVHFANGNRLNIHSNGELFLEHAQDTLMLTARLDREEYVARVLEREASTTPPEAAKAMTVAIRTYLLQQAQRGESCLLIEDSSATQRVAPSPAGTPAREITAWTQDLILAGTPVNYHYERSGPELLSWQQAITQAKQGARFDAILAHAFPKANLSRWDKPEVTCQPLPKAEAWLHKQRVLWRLKLDQEPGYLATDHFAVCHLPYGTPFADRKQRRIYIRNFYSLQDRLDLTHEYLHLAFDGHPNTLDEHYIETLTRQLLLE